MAQLYEGTEIGDEMEILFKASQILCTEIEKTKDWHFTGHLMASSHLGRFSSFLNE